ncbi:hypothetical protein ACFOWE_03895 [Planomonospora corallina]|uniref:Uncharacterized protein n=1 Tax=Planomonospora corallina TaxID=1806052 RepID=A0ABV8I663_9ACTN
MGKFDGMDPELVRGLLAEVKQAAERMRTIEGRVTRLMSAAGLSSQSAHRPVRIADECDTMVKDVSARVALLEKKIEQNGKPGPGSEAADPKAGTPAQEAPKAAEKDGAKTDAPKGDTPEGEDRKGETSKPDAPKAEDRKPDAPKDGDRKPDAPREETPKAEDRKPDAPREEDRRPDAQRSETPRAGDLRPAVPDSGAAGDGTGRGTGPESGAGSGETKPESGSKGDDRSPRAEESGRDAPRTEQDSTPDRKPETDAKGDERSPRADGGTPDGGTPDGGAPGGNGAAEPVPDTPAKDHPDDVDQGGERRPQVVEVDGVKVLQIPLDPPAAEQLEELLENIEDVPPADMPSVDGVSYTEDTRPGQVEPHEPLPSAKPDVPLLDTAEPAEGQTVQPPGTGGETEQRTAATPDGSGGSTGESGGSAKPGGSTGSGESGRADGSGTADDSTRSGESGGSGEPAQRRPAGDEGVSVQVEGDVISVRVELPDLEAIRTLAENARAVEPLEMPGVQVPEGEAWGEGAWRPMDVGPDGPAGELDPQDPRRPIPPPGGSSV